MKILQIIPSFQNVEYGVPLRLYPYGTPRPKGEIKECIIGMALVEYDNGDTGIEWVVWNPKTRGIRITDESFNRDSARRNEYES